MNPEQLFDMEMDEVELDDCIDKNIENLARLVWLKFYRKNLSNFEDLEIEVRDFLLRRVGPELTEKIIEYLTGIKKGKKRELTTIVGKISIRDLRENKIPVKKGQW